MNNESPKKTLRRLAEARRGVLVPGAFNALSARVIEDLGFEAVYITGAGVTNMHFGLPDQAFMGLHEIAEHTARIRDAVTLPLLVDADTGFGNALNVRHAVRVLERAGADCIQLEDQVSPKRCGHFAGKAVIDTAEMLGKIKAAVDARTDAAAPRQAAAHEHGDRRQDADLRRRRARCARRWAGAVCQCRVAGRSGWHATCVDRVARYSPPRRRPIARGFVCRTATPGRQTRARRVREKIRRLSRISSKKCALWLSTQKVPRHCFSFMNTAIRLARVFPCHCGANFRASKARSRRKLK
ncbi:hypothetical protein QFZ47_004627 [Variovorax paradoxus]|nr:hypothetical protein [Variovorax paradoxus]